MQQDKKKLVIRLLVFAALSGMHYLLLLWAWAYSDITPNVMGGYLPKIANIAWPILSFPLVWLLQKVSGGTPWDIFLLQFLLNSLIWAGAILAGLIYASKNFGREF